MVESNQQGIDVKQLEKALSEQTEWSQAVIFYENGDIIAKRNCETNKQELAVYAKAYDSRDNTIGAGFVLGKKHYDVHRFHPPLIYGRRGDADVGEGISLCRGTCRSTKQRIYMIICYELPIISARAVPQQINFFNKEIGELDKMLS